MGQAFDSAPENLRLVGRAGAAKNDTADEKGINGNTDADEQAVAEEQQHQNGHTSEKPNIQRYQPPKPGAAIDLGHGHGAPRHYRAVADFWP